MIEYIKLVYGLCSVDYCVGMCFDQKAVGFMGSWGVGEWGSVGCSEGLGSWWWMLSGLGVGLFRSLCVGLYVFCVYV